MYGIKFTIKYKDIIFENFSVFYDAYLNFSGSGILTFSDFDSLLNKEDLISKEDFADLLLEDYFGDFNLYEDTIHLNQDDVDFVYNEYVKQYKNEWDQVYLTLQKK